MITIRAATPADAGAISCFIVRALRRTNGRDYPPVVIDALVHKFSTERVIAFIATRNVYVADCSRVAVGTAGLQGSFVRSVYVDPDHQGRGVGTKLMEKIEDLARARIVATLVVPSSVTAFGFYSRLGFSPVREEVHWNARTIIMHKQIMPTTSYDGAR